MIQFKAFLWGYLLCWTGAALQAQSGEVCYERFVKEAKVAEQALEFDLAIYKLEAAEICPDKPLANNLDELLKKVNENKIKAVIEARDRAERSEKMAIQQLAISESNRFAFLANREREKGNAKEGLKLAFHAMQLVGDSISLAVQRAFGDAVYSAAIKYLQGHRRAIFAVNFSPDGQYILTASQDSTLILWNNGGEKLWQSLAFSDPIQSAQFSPDGQHLLTASGREVSIWNLEGQRETLLQGHSDLVFEAVFSNDGKWVASCSRDQKVYIWDWGNGIRKTTCSGAKAAVNKIQFSADDTHLLGVSADKAVRIWAMDGTIKQTIQHNNRYFTGATFGPQPGLMMTHTVDHELQVWDIASGEWVGDITAHKGMIRQVTLAPDASGFITCSTDRLAIFWNAIGEEQFRFDDHKLTVVDAEFSSDGRHILTASDDGTAKYYDRQGELLMDISQSIGRLRDIDISPNNQQIVLVGDLPVVALCPTPESYYLYLQNNPPEPFTAEEKVKYSISDSFN